MLMARVSSDEQAKGYSLDVQTEAIEGYCLRNGIDIVYTIREDHSAKSFERPEFNRFLSWLKGNRNQVDLLLFTSWDRFSRNAMDAYRMIERLGRQGVEAQAIEQPIDFSVPENKMMLAMYLVMPEVDNDRRSIKIRGGIRAALKAGRWCRAAPYGYKNSRDEHNRPIIVPSERAEVIRWAFEQVAKGQSQSEVRAEVNRKGIPIQRSRFSEMLRNPMYMGMIEVPAQDNEPYMLIKGQHEALVSEEVFYQVQQVLTGNFPRKRLSVSRINEFLPLRGILKCTGCSGKLTGSRSRSRNGKQHAYYHYNHCRNERYRAELANATVTEIMNSLTLDSDAEVILQQLFVQLFNGNSDQRKRIERELKEEIQRQNTRIQTLQDNLADGVIGGDDYREMRTRYVSLRDEATRKLSELSSDVSEKKELIEKAVGIMNSLGDLFENENAETRSKLLGSIFPDMIEFDGEECRTTSINSALLLCLAIDADSSPNKNRTLPDKLVVSGRVENTGVEPVTSCLPGKRSSQLS